MMFAGFAPAMVHVQSGKLVAIGMSTEARLRAAPDIPSVFETPGLESYDFPVWVGLFAPSGTHRDRPFERLRQPARAGVGCADAGESVVAGVR